MLKGKQRGKSSHQKQSTGSIRTTDISLARGRTIWTGAKYMVKDSDSQRPYSTPAHPNITLRRKKKGESGVSSALPLIMETYHEGSGVYIPSVATRLSGVGKPQRTDVDDSTARPALFTPISHPVLTSLDPRHIISFLEKRESYLLEVEEKNKEGGNITPASYKVSVKPVILRSMYLLGHFKDVAPGKEFKDIAANDIEAAITKLVGKINEKRISTSTLSAAMSKLRTDMTIEEPEARIDMLVVDFIQALSSLGAEEFTKDNPKASIKYIVEALHPPQLKAKVRQDLEVYEDLAKDFTMFIQHAKLSATHIQEAMSADKALQYERKRSNRQGMASGPAASTHKSNPYVNPGGKNSKRKDEKSLPLCLYRPCKEAGRRHFMKNCTYSSEEDKKKLLAEYRKHNAGRIKNFRRKIDTPQTEKRADCHKSSMKTITEITDDTVDNTRFDANFAGVASRTLCADGGADANLLPKDVAAAVLNRKGEIKIKRLNKPRWFSMAVTSDNNGREVAVSCKREAEISEVTLDCRHGTSLTLRNTKWLIPEQDCSEPLLGRPVLSALGLNTGRLLRAAANKFAGTVDLSQIPINYSSSKSSISAMLERDAMFHANPQGEEAEEDLPELEIGIDRPHEVTAAIESRVHEAEANGLSQKVPQICVTYYTLVKRRCVYA